MIQYGKGLLDILGLTEKKNTKKKTVPPKPKKAKATKPKPKPVTKKAKK
jgi:hypothetical protein